MTRLVRPLRGGQITIPAEYRRRLGITDDSLLQMSAEHGELRIKPVRVTDQASADWVKELYDLFAPVRTQTSEASRRSTRRLTRPCRLPARGVSDLVVIFNTVVFIRVLINPHSFWGRLVFEHFQEYRLIMTLPIVRGIVKVLQRPELTSRFTTLKWIDAARVLEILQHAAVVLPPQEPQVSRDVKDNKFLAAAGAAKADYLVSKDKDLLDLIQHHGTHIVPAENFLALLKTRREAT